MANAGDRRPGAALSECVRAPSDDLPGAVRDGLSDVAVIAHHRLLFERSPDAILVAAIDGHYLDANSAALALLGYERDELLRLRLEDIVIPGPSWNPQTYAHFIERGHWEGEVAVRTRDGVLVPTSARTVVFAEQDGGTHITVLRDLTERNRNAVTRARLAALISSSGDAVVGETLDGIVTDWNPAAERLYGYSADEVIGRPLQLLISPDRLQEAEELLLRARRGESIEGFETIRWTKDGRRIDVSLTVSPVRNDAGQIIGTSAIIRDVTERVRLEQELCTSQNQFASAFEHAAIGMALVGLDGRWLKVNPALCDLTGYSEEDLLARTFQDVTHPEDLKSDLAQVADLLDGRIRSYNLEKRYVRGDGTVVWVLLSTSLVRDEAGLPLHFISQVQDISERKVAEAERAATHQNTHEVLERITDGFYALDQEWRFSYVNETAERILGRSREELVGKCIWDEFGPALETPVPAAFHRAMAEGITTSVDFYYVPLSAWFELRAYPSPNGLSVFFRDITARRQLEQELRTSETKYRALVEQLPAVVYVLAADEQQTPLYFSERFQQLTGFRPDEALVRTEHWLSHVHPDDRAAVAAEDSRTVGSAEPFQMEYRHLRRDGSYVWVQDECAAIRDEAGQVISWQGVLLDITGRKAAEAALAQERDLLRVLMNSTPDAIYFKDEASRFTRVNRAAARFYGLDDPAAALGKTDFDFYPEEQARGFWDDERQVIEQGTPLVNWLEHQSGEGDAARWTQATKVPLFDPDGSISGLVGISRDVTDVIRAQEALRRSEARFRSLITNATDLITILAADGTILYQSPPIERILGYDQDELVGRNAFDLVHPEDRAATWAAFADALADPTRVPTVEFQFLHADGSWRWLESTGTNLLADGDVGGFVVNSRDITERKRVDEELRAALDGAQAATRTKSLFLAMMSHELRTPLQAVLGYADLLLGEAEGTLTTQQREDLGYIRAGAGRMVTLIDQLLDLSRMEAGRLELAQEPVDLGEIIEQVRQDVAPQAAMQGLDLHIELAPALPLVRGDADRMRQILLNLVGNAVKFTEQGSVRISASASDDEVMVAVHDTGIGITAGTLPVIFEEFRQVDGSLTRRHGGAGLGLAVAHKLAEHMQGTITVLSQPGVGSTFTLYLPCRPETHNSAG